MQTSYKILQNFATLLQNIANICFCKTKRFFHENFNKLCKVLREFCKKVAKKKKYFAKKKIFCDNRETSRKSRKTQQASRKILQNYVNLSPNLTKLCFCTTLRFFHEKILQLCKVLQIFCEKVAKEKKYYAKK